MLNRPSASVSPPGCASTVTEAPPRPSRVPLARMRPRNGTSGSGGGAGATATGRRRVSATPASAPVTASGPSAGALPSARSSSSGGDEAASGSAPASGDPPGPDDSCAANTIHGGSQPKLNAPAPGKGPSLSCHLACLVAVDPDR